MKTPILGHFLLIAALALTARRLLADEIVFDPTNFGQITEILRHDIEILKNAKDQLQAQIKMLAHQAGLVPQEITRELEALRSALSASLATSPAELKDKYPYDKNLPVWKNDAQVERYRENWLQNRRDALDENAQVQKQVADSMASVPGRLSEDLKNSQSAPGMTAALQVTNDELAVLSSQLQALITLELSESHRRTQESARQDSEQAYAKAMGEAMLKKNYAPSQKSIPDPFPLCPN